MQSAGSPRPGRRRWNFYQSATAAVVAMLLACLHLAGAQFLPAEADLSRLTTAQRTARAACKVSYSCANFPFFRTPFSVSNVRYDDSSGKLCYQLSANRGCPTCTYACRHTTGIQALYQLASDSGIQGHVSSTSIKPTSGKTAKMSPPTCLSKVGIAAKVAVQQPKGLVVQGGLLMKSGAGAASLCIQYPAGMPFRRIGSVAAPAAAAPQASACCSAKAAYKPLSATLQVWARGAGPVHGSGASCQACTNAKVAIAAGSISGTVWQDADGNGRYTVGLDEGWEGVTVNLWRLSGSVRTFMGCATTDGSGAYKFSKVVADTYQVQIVAPDGGSRSTMKFGRLSTSLKASNVNPGSGNSPSFKLKGGTKEINACIAIVPVSSSKRRRRLH